MLCLCILFSFLATTTTAQKLRVNGKVGQKSEVEQLREQASMLQQELSEMPTEEQLAVTSSDDSGLKQASEVAFQIPTDLQQDDWQPVAGMAPTQASLQQVQTAQRKRQSLEGSPLATPGGSAAPAGDAKAAPAAPAAASAAKKEKINAVRPNAGKGPEEITFGLFAKNFFGADLKNNNFAIDIVMTLKWIDKRVTQLIPEGMDELTLSKKEADLSIWLPFTVVTNRDLKKYDLISTAVTINRQGEVFKVERAMCVIKNKYILNDYPYDNQKMVVRIASSKYMIDEVVFKPSEDGSGVADGLFNGYSYDFLNFGTTAIKDVDGALKKSRGLLTITVKRNPDQYTQAHLVPCFLVTCISCGVFWFPFVAPFITPRVALSILSLLAFTNLSGASDAMLPPGAPFNWNDCFNQTILTIMFCNVVLNIFSEICFHQLKVDDVAKSINHECKALMPFVAAVSAFIIMSSAGPDGWSLSLEQVSIIVKCVLVLTIGGFLAFNYPRITGALAKKKEAEAQKAAKEAQEAAGKPIGTNPNLKASA